MNNQPCTRPPAGWTCSRPEGHEGPCAASPVDDCPEPSDPHASQGIKEQFLGPSWAKPIPEITARAKESKLWPDLEHQEGRTLPYLLERYLLLENWRFYERHKQTEEEHGPQPISVYDLSYLHNIVAELATVALAQEERIRELERHLNRSTDALEKARLAEVPIDIQVEHVLQIDGRGTVLVIDGREDVIVGSRVRHNGAVYVVRDIEKYGNLFDGTPSGKVGLVVKKEVDAPQ